MKTTALASILLAALAVACSSSPGDSAANEAPANDEVADLGESDLADTDARPDDADEASELGDDDPLAASTADVEGPEAPLDPSDADDDTDADIAASFPYGSTTTSTSAVSSLGFLGDGKSARAPNVGFGGRWRGDKVGGWVTATNACDGEALVYLPAAGSAPVQSYAGKTVRLAKGRPVLVQMAPGLRNGMVWVDPDMISISRRRVEQLFGAAVTPASPKFGVRGFFPAECLRRGTAGAPFPTKHVLHPVGDAEPLSGSGVAMTVRANAANTAVQCDVKAKYKKAGGSSYANYAGKNPYSQGIYLNYNTTGALYQGTIRGGGMTLGYVLVGETFHVVSKRDDRSVARNKRENPTGKLDVNLGSGKGADDRHPGLWAYGYVDRKGTKEWGYVYYDCLTTSSESAPAPPPTQAADDCNGKADGLYCGSLGDQAYRCAGGKIAGGDACPSGQTCIGPNGPGAAIECE